MDTKIQDQPTPKWQPNVVAVQDLVIQDMRERKAVGEARYGTPLQAHNGRDALVDAYQEALNLCCYLRQAIEERPNVKAREFSALADREAELLLLKGPCSSANCCLHYAHRGPCDIRKASA